MTILQALNGCYDRMVAQGIYVPIGYSRENISYVILLSEDGEVEGVVDLRDTAEKNPVPKLLAVPAAEKRTSGIGPNKLWDKTSYVLGVTAGDGKRVINEHEAFKALHADLLDRKSVV